VFRFLLIRHCQSSGQAPEAPLTDEGRAQALRLSAFLAEHPVDIVVSSPYLRARETIAPFAARASLRVQIDERLAERRISPEPILHWREIVRDSFEDLELRAPGGESARETLARGWAALEALRAHEGRLPAVVTHGNLMGLVLHSIDSTFGFSGWLGLSNPDVYRVEQRDGRYRFQRVWR
jgi:2,3-bisphosphoglycerate-dependent phosphoglycerate mutase